MSSVTAQPVEIAIVGIGCRYPGGGSNPRAFWEMLCNGTDAVTEVPPQRWNADRFADRTGKTPGTMCVKHAAFLDDPVDAFDAEFFGISPREAGCMDPQHRLLFEVTWEAFEDGGIVPSVLRGSNTGVYSGGFTVDYYADQLNAVSMSKTSQHTATGGTIGMMSNRLSYWLDFRGPSLTIDTACSSSLVALHYACEDLRHARTDMALVTGVNIMINPMTTSIMSKGGFLAPDGRSKAFSAAADGYGRGEGAGAVILKPLKQAIEDGNRIYSVILASGVNQDGHTNGIASPNQDAQQELISDIFAKNRIDPGDVVLIEAHGTGTAIGDPVEVNALSESLAASEHRPRYIGSVKANIGHQEAGAGLAGVIKASLCLQHGKAPPQINVSTSNPAIDFKSFGFNLAQQVETLPNSQSGKRLACVNSFGFGGTNAHAVLQQAPVIASHKYSTDTADNEQILCVSARSPGALSMLCEQYSRLLGDEEVRLEDVCYSAAFHRDHLSYRQAVVSSTASGMRDQLDILARKHLHEKSDQTSRLVWVFTGMGPQWSGMGRQLYRSEPVFRKTLEAVCLAFERFAGWSLLDEMFKDEHGSRLHRNDIAQPANFALQTALARLWLSWGIKPDAIIGHSIGEVAAAWAAGAVELDTAAEIAFHRSRLQQKMAGRGRLLAAGVGDKVARDIVNLYQSQISLAAINSPSSCALSGNEAVLLEVARMLDEEGFFQRMVNGEVAYHSLQMASLEEELKQSLRDVASVTPTIPLYSTVTGELASDIRHDADYWWDNVRQPVYFESAIRRILADGYTRFVEVGPHPVLSMAISECAESANASVRIFPTLRRNEDERKVMLETVAGLYTAGIDVDWSRIVAMANYVDLPLYPWQRKQFEINSYEIVHQRTAEQDFPWLGVRDSVPQHGWKNVLPNQYTPEIFDHVIDGQALFPAAGYIDVFLSAANQAFGQETLSLSDLGFYNVLSIDEDSHVQTSVSLDDDNTMKFYSCELGFPDKWVDHASARVVTRPYRRTQDKVDHDAMISRCQRYLDKTATYERLLHRSLQYGPAFQVIEEVSMGDAELIARIENPVRPGRSGRHHFPPYLVDGCFQTLALFGDDDRPAVPVSVEDLHVYGPLPDRFYCHSSLVETGQLGVKADIGIYDEQHSLCMKMSGVRAACLPSRVVDEWIYSWDWSRYGKVEKEDSPGPEKIIWHAQHRENDTTGEKLCLRLIQAIQGFTDQMPCHLIVVTQGAQHVLPEDGVNPAMAALWGAARVARSEYPELNLTLIDVDRVDAIDGMDSVMETSGEYAIRNRLIYEHTLLKGSPAAYRSVAHSDEMGFSLKPGANGLLSEMFFETSRDNEIKPGEVGVSVHYAAVNMKDVLKALGRLGVETMENTLSGVNLGLEGAGYVEKVGADVSGYRVGDKVLLSCPAGTFNPHVVIDPLHAPLFKWQGEEPLEQLAGIQVVFGTAERALVDVANLRRGEFVLLHSAAGAVGHAAIQVAHRVGATVIATASSEQKRHSIKRMGVDLIYDSRSLNFVDEVLKITGGKGVDVALNFLSGDSMNATLSCMAQFGRFVEIGKEDISNHGSLPLKYFQKNLVFASVDMDRLIRERLDLYIALVQRVNQYFREGQYTPVPTAIYPADRSDEAFQQLLQPTHIGKVIIDMRTSAVDGLVVHSPGVDIRKIINPDFAYIVTGGFGGFGLKVAKWLGDLGARHIVLIGRGGAGNTQAAEAISVLRETGVDVKEVAADAGDGDAVRRLFRELQQDSLVIKGIFHCAAVLDDAVIEKQSADRFASAFAAKARSAQLLHDISLEFGLRLDLFVLFSSISAVIGNQGQANYAAANAYLDGLAALRRSQGLPALSVAWGAISDAGMLTKDNKTMSHLQRRGLQAITSVQALNQLEHGLLTGAEHIGIFSIDWRQYHERQSGRVVPALRRVVQAKPGGEDDSENMQESILSLPHEYRLDAVHGVVCDTLNDLLKISHPSTEKFTPLNSIGMDSLMLMEFIMALQKKLGIKISPADIQITMTVWNISERLMALIDRDKKREDVVSEPATVQDPDIDHLADEAVEQLYVRVVAHPVLD